MRKFGMLVVSGAVIMMSVAWVEGQQGGGRFGGFGGFGGRGNAGPLGLLNREDVKKELDVSEEQLEKLPPEVMTAIGKVLNEKQFKRFKQIELQQRGTNAFKDPTVQKELKMTSAQKTNIVSLITDADKEIKDLMPKRGGFGKGGKGGKGGGDFKAAFEKISTIRKDTKEKIFGVLTKDQRKSYREMVGEEFKFQQPNFGGGKKGKKDAE